MEKLNSNRSISNVDLGSHMSAEALYQGKRMSEPEYEWWSCLAAAAGLNLAKVV